ncbi:MAG: DMT family transporter [Eubacteriaceae bacterium]|nr:DMT family transporter [Eubacteriaceae bacterium]
MIEKMSTKSTMLLMALTAFMWSTSGLFIKMISWNPLFIAGGRSLLTAGVLFIFIKKSGARVKINKASLAIAIPIMINITLFVVANKLTTAANVIVIQYAAPVWIVVLSAIFLHQKFSKVDITVVAVTMCGILLFFLDQLSMEGILGNILALFAGIAMAVMYIINKEVSHDDPDSQASGIMLGQLLTALVGAVALFFVPFHTTGLEISYIVFLGIVQMGIPYVFYTLIQRKLPTLTCSLIAMIEPLFNPVWVVLFYGEKPGRFALVGAAIIIVTIARWCVWQAKNEIPAE